QIVLPGDPEKFIHVPISAQDGVDSSPAVQCSLTDLEISISTGPVVDFRLKSHLRAMPGADTVPLLYAGHFRNAGTVWPIKGFRKANAIVRNTETERWLYPNGHYCVVRRFSSKEERRRITAAVVEPGVLGDAQVV